MDEQGINETLRNITAWIKDEIDSGIPANRIVLGGFSQGSAMSLLHAVNTDEKLAGFIALSGWLPKASAIEAVCTKEFCSSHVTHLPHITFASIVNRDQQGNTHIPRSWQ